jgi:hypothetical protein
MHFPTRITLTLTLLVAIAGCGSKQAASTPAQAPTATLLATGTPPRQGSSSPTTSSKSTNPAIATGRHDHLGELCSGRDEARFVGEDMLCVAGRLQKRRG